MLFDDRRKRARPSELAGRARHERAARRLPAIGLEAEFATIVDGDIARPEDVFGSPRRIVRGPMVHRTGRSYHLPTGGAVYFDTGVIEVATPLIEIERGCAARGTRSLWESLAFLRAELDAWEERHARSVRLVGFSTHYNVSFEPPGAAGDERTVERFAYLLAHVLAAPVMLLAANRRSTGIGVRPRGDRIEVTADFTPDAALMAATATLIVGVVRATMAWPSYELGELARRRIPVVGGFAPVPHSTRKGWVARPESFPRNPFAADVDDACWRTSDGRALSLREMAGRTTRVFWRSIRALGDSLSLQLIAAVMRGRAPSLLELPDRPAAYDDVGRLCRWDDLFPIALLPRSRYERVVSGAVSGRRLRMEGRWHRPVGVRGWTHIVLRREHDGARRVMSLDEMLAHLDAWDRTADRRLSERRARRAFRAIERRLLADRRAALALLLERRRAAEAGLGASTPPRIAGGATPPAEGRRRDNEVPLPSSAEPVPRPVERGDAAAHAAPHAAHDARSDDARRHAH
jgi:hypothetical protein